MKYKLQDLIDIPLCQNLFEKLNEMYSFSSSIVDNEGVVLTATGWQDICKKFHRANKECERECIKSDKYIISHLSDANPSVIYSCPNGLTEIATPIIIEGKHLGNFFVGQFFFEKPDISFFIKQARKYNFCEQEYFKAVEKVPVFSELFLNKNIAVIKTFTEMLVSLGLRNLHEKEYSRALKISEDELKLKNEEYERINRELSIEKKNAEDSDSLKTLFLQNISHEIRTPMNAIIGFSKRLQKPGLSDEKQKSYSKIIINNANHLLEIVSDILTISSLDTKQEKINITRVDLNALLIELLEIFKMQSSNQEASLHINLPLPDRASEIFTDKTKVAQILTNLIANALKFTPRGFIEFGYNLKSNELEFYVKDSGIGIKKEQQEKIFERLIQAEREIKIKYSGTGLGLSISKGFVTLLGGKIRVQSEVGKGSIFYFTIPYHPVHENDEIPIKEEDFQTILVAEDDEDSYFLLEELLTEMNYKVIHAWNGEEAVEICKSQPNIHLIFMDIRMPRMDGNTAAKLIKEQRPFIKIIGLSSFSLEQVPGIYSEQVFDDYLRKPVNDEELKKQLVKFSREGHSSVNL